MKKTKKKNYREKNNNEKNYEEKNQYNDNEDNHNKDLEKMQRSLENMIQTREKDTLGLPMAINQVYRTFKLVKFNGKLKSCALL